MGVSGCGKSTVGRKLAAELGWDFVDADRFHLPASRAKMSAGRPLDDADRGPWLKVLGQLLRDHLSDNRSIVLACSALKASYRKRLTVSAAVRFVLLHGDPAIIARRLAERSEHFMPAGLLASQLQALELPDHAIRLDIAATPDEIVARIRNILKL